MIPAPAGVVWSALDHVRFVNAQAELAKDIVKA
jgi:hypothetical protein